MSSTSSTVTTAPLPPEAVRLVRLSVLLTRVATGTLLVTLGVVVLTSSAAFQHHEATAAAWALELLGRPAQLLTSSPTVLFQRTPGDESSWVGLAATAGHSAVNAVGGTLVVAGLLAFLRARVRPSRLFMSAAHTVLSLLLVNTAHLVLVAESASRWGSDPSGWVHVIAGQALLATTLSTSLLWGTRRGPYMHSHAISCL